MNEPFITIENILEVRQPVGLFLLGRVKASQLLKITHSDPRRYNQELDDYVGIQREIDEKKIKQLREFINTSDAAMPNSIIGTLKPDKYEYVSGPKILKIEENSDSFAIIDGQHRLASFSYQKIAENFEIIVTFFVELDIEMQAYLFSIINMNQKKLNPSLMQDLTELFTITTPDKLAHNLAKAFNKKENSPWNKQIKMLGTREDAYAGIISQYTFTREIVNLTADTRLYYRIRDILKKTKNQRKYLNDIEMPIGKHVLWKFYVEENDHGIYTMLETYFNSIKNAFPLEWCNKDFILSKTTGYIAFMNFFRQLYLKAVQEKRKLDVSFFDAYIGKIGKVTARLDSTNYPPGKEGEKKLYDDLLKVIS